MKNEAQDKKIIKVKLSLLGKDIPFARFTPNSSGVWENYKFYVNEDVDEVDWWVVGEGLNTTEKTICPKENTIFLAHENEFMKNYQQKFLDQFAHVVTCHRTMEHPHKILTLQGHHSHLGWSRRGLDQSLEDFKKQFPTYDQFKTMGPENVPKTKLMSVVTSHKTKTEGQQLRNDFNNAMKKHFGNRMDAFSNLPNIFGPDTKYEKDKWNAMAPYKYYLAVENSYVPHYWTTNISDAYLSFCYPIYYGHPSILDYFPKEALTLIDIHDIPGSIETIEKVISENYYEKHLPDIIKAREIYLEKLQLFPMLVNIIKSLEKSNDKKELTIKPEGGFLSEHIFINKVKNIPILKFLKPIYHKIKKI